MIVLRYQKMIVLATMAQRGPQVGTVLSQGERWRLEKRNTERDPVREKSRQQEATRSSISRSRPQLFERKKKST